MMKKFMGYLLFLTLPFLVFLPLPLYCLCVTGEIKPFDRYLIELDKGQLWGLAYNYYDREYKFFMTEKFEPEILALGTSRSMQIDGNIFNSKYSFYNAGGAVQNPQDYIEFIKRLSYNPKLVIIDLNHFFFNPNSDKSSPAIYKKPELNSLTILKNCINVYKDICLGKIRMVKFSNEHIGMLAKMECDGFTNTGFYHYGRITNNPVHASDYNFKNSINRIMTHSDRFQTCNIVDLKVVEQIKTFVKECNSRGIKLIGFLPPFSHYVINEMKKDGNYQYINMIYSYLKPSFEGEGNNLYDYTDVSRIGGNDFYFIDGFHAGVPVVNLIFKDIITNDNSLSDFFTTTEKMDSIIIEYKKVHPPFHSVN